MSETAEDGVDARYRQALREGRLDFQACTACGHAWLPARTECPSCLHPAHEWRAAGGAANLVSWVVYHTPPNAKMADRTPYNVAIVELAEGPRLISNVVDAAPGALRIDAKLSLMIGEIDGLAAPMFKLRNP